MEVYGLHTIKWLNSSITQVFKRKIFFTTKPYVVWCYPRKWKPKIIRSRNQNKQKNTKNNYNKQLHSHSLKKEKMDDCPNGKDYVVSAALSRVSQVNSVESKHCRQFIGIINSKYRSSNQRL